VNDRQLSPALAAIPIGAGVGAALFAATGNPAFIGIGAGIGVVFWGIWQQRG